MMKIAIENNSTLLSDIYSHATINLSLGFLTFIDIGFYSYLSVSLNFPMQFVLIILSFIFFLSCIEKKDHSINQINKKTEERKAHVDSVNNEIQQIEPIYSISEITNELSGQQSFSIYFDEKITKKQIISLVEYLDNRTKLIFLDKKEPYHLEKGVYFRDNKIYPYRNDDPFGDSNDLLSISKKKIV